MSALHHRAYSCGPEAADAATPSAPVRSASARGTYTDPPHSVEQFLAQMELPLYRYVARQIGSDEEAVDLVQDAMLRWVEAGYDRKPPEQWRALLYRIQLNRIRDWGRARRRARVLGFFSLTPDPAKTECDEAERHPAAPRQDCPDAAHAAFCLGAALTAALQTLPPRQREAFNLRILEELDTRAAATAMGVSPGSVMTHLYRATHALQAALAEYRTDPEADAGR